MRQDGTDSPRSMFVPWVITGSDNGPTFRACPHRHRSALPPAVLDGFHYAPNANYWLDPLLKVGYKQTHAALIKPNLSSIPAGAIIAEAWLEVYAVGWSGLGADITIGAYAISGTVVISETTWNEALHGDLWALPGCNDLFLDRCPQAESSLTMSGPHK